MREQRIPPMATQLQHRQEAAQNRQQFASVNHGRPAVLAATKPIPKGKPIAPVIPAHAAAVARPAPAEPRGEPSRPAAHPAPAKAMTPPRAAPKPAPTHEARPATLPPHERGAEHRAPEAKPNTAHPPAKKEQPNDKKEEPKEKKPE
jgi:hypothetical protein